MEVGMLQRVPGVDTLPPVQLEQFGKQVLGFWVQTANECQHIAFAVTAVG